MNKTEKTIREYVSGNKSFTWISDIAEHTIWGFKNAPYKTYKRASDKVKDVVDSMVAEGLACVEECEGYQPQIRPL